MQLPAGFRFAGAACGIKDSGSPDLTLIACDSPCVAAGVYTQNLVCAAPVELNRARTPMTDCGGVVINSGNANACTGKRGMEDALQMTQWAGAAVGLAGRQLLVMSTGIIGHRLPMAEIERGIQAAADQLASDINAFEAAAHAMLTTDKGIKVASRSLASGGALAGMVKGAGMIGPQMATMLGVVLTDVELTPDQAQTLLKNASDVSFNSIRVEGHTSTNDTVLLLASGVAGPADEDALQLELNQLCIELAKKIPADGEGASHLMEVHVSGCATSEQARQIATAVADSPLVKTAVTGNDPNWGRIVSAAGYAGVPFDVSQLSLELNGTVLYQNGEPLTYDEAAVSASMREQAEVKMWLSAGNGPGEACIWASDLTIDYVNFNSEYTT